MKSSLKTIRKPCPREREQVRAGWALAFAGAVLLLAPVARAQDASPGPHEEDQIDGMTLLAKHGLHDITRESWNAYGQITWVEQFKPGFPARYTNLNGSNSSLLPTPEWGDTGSATLYFGLHLWPEAEAYFVPEVITEKPFSNLKGLTGAIQDFELQKGGTTTPQLYRSRAFLKQTIELGGEKVPVESNPMQLGTVYQRRRIDFAIGSFSVLDFFDRTPFGIDPRHGGFFSLAYVTYAAYDFASDARGYSWGGVVELYWDDWAIRFGRVTPPQQPNQLATDFRLWLYYGDNLEIEHDHTLLGQKGIVRLLGFHNHEDMGSFSDAIAAFEAHPQVDNAANCGKSPALDGYNYGSMNANAPDLCWVRKPSDKYGIGLYIEQYVAPDIGVFFRGMYADGQTEVDAYTSADRSLSLGALAKGTLWHRHHDYAGLAGNLSWVSEEHATYLEMGGVDGFIGDGNLSPGPETTFDVFYSVGIYTGIWLSADYQHIINPGMNTDRGPVDVFGGKVRLEF